MHDLSQDSWLRKRDLQDRLTALIGRYGYRFLETPILEPTELFLRKSGGELASRMYSFTDAEGNQVSLRPEFTSPIMRYYLEHATTIELPARWQYAGPVFRYGDDGNMVGSGLLSTRARQFTQVGAELLGSAGVAADAELLRLASVVPCHLGLSGCWLELGNLDVLYSVLDAVGVSERARTFIVGSVPQLRKGRAALPTVLERAQQLHLAGQAAEDSYLSAAIEGLGDTEARKVLRGLLQWTAVDQLGQRDSEEVVERLLRKLRGSDDLSNLQRGLELIADLAAVHGEPDAAIHAARAVILQAGADPAVLDRLSELLRLMEFASIPVPLSISDGEGVAKPGVRLPILLDFGLARGLAYYNGIIFEVKHPGWQSSLGGGGRYDGLARALGGPDTVPALGFAYTLEALSVLTEDQRDESAKG